MDMAHDEEGCIVYHVVRALDTWVSQAASRSSLSQRRRRAKDLLRRRTASVGL